MPELPEVETTRKGLSPALTKQRIRGVLVRERRLRWPLPADFEKSLTGRQVIDVGRRAKYLLIQLDKGHLLIHLGMSGSLRVLSKPTPPQKHDHVDLVLSSGCIVRYNDPRRFGSMHFLTGNPHDHPLLNHLGPEPLADAFSSTYLHDQIRHRSVAIKLCIMNASVVVGVGNIYASEALFRAHICPTRSAGKLKAWEVVALVAAIKQVLGAAIKAGGTTLRDYVDTSGTPGYFRQKLFVYERAGEPCRRCQTPIRHKVQGQRSTYWCPSCQI
jgi:formamidopyrimidine-DNA glycosylase